MTCNYIYQTEDGSMYQSSEPPTDEEIQSIVDGYLAVIRYTGDGFVNIYEDGKEYDLVVWGDEARQ